MASRGVTRSAQAQAFRHSLSMPASPMWPPQAGFKETVVAGHAHHADYIIEAMSCGVAFLDYDNDGWLDILVLSGSRLGDPPADASNRLYKNNRDGTFTDVTEKAGSVPNRVRVRGDCRRLQQRRFRRPLHHLLGAERSLSQQRRRHIHRRHQTGRPAQCRAALRFRVHLPRLRPRRKARSVRVELRRLRHENHAARRQDLQLACLLRPARPALRPPLALSQQRRRHFHRCQRAFWNFGEVAGGYGLTVVSADFDNDGWPDIYVACDSTPSLLFHNNHDGTFTEQGLERGVALSEDGMVQAGMGLGIGDLQSGRRAGHCEDPFLERYRGDVH